MTTKLMVIEDPSGKYWPGAVEDAGRASALAAQGVWTIPVEEAYMPAPESVPRARRNACLGFFRRDYGAGWPIARMAANMCPATLYMLPGQARVHWRARLVAREAGGPSGQLRLASCHQAGATLGGLSASAVAAPVELSKIGPPDAHGGWTVGGESPTALITEGWSGLALYGYSVGAPVSVKWFVVSVTG